jgi:hypothetical protein
MAETVKLEKELLRKQRQREELSFRYKLACETEVQSLANVMLGAQMSIHVIEGRNLRVDMRNTPRRKIRLVVEKNIVESKEHIAQGFETKARWHESFLLPVTSREKPVKVILLHKERNRDRVLGGTQLYLDKYAD